MSKYAKISLLAVTIVAGLAAVPQLRADESSKGMMTGEDGMMEMMMKMMGQSKMTGQSQTMEQCGQMMQGMMSGGTEKPNEQWRRERPAEPGTKD